MFYLFNRHASAIIALTWCAQQLLDSKQCHDSSLKFYELPISSRRKPVKNTPFPPLRIHIFFTLKIRVWTIICRFHFYSPLPGTKKKANHCKNGWKWLLPTISYVKIWFIIQLKQPFLKTVDLRKSVRFFQISLPWKALWQSFWVLCAAHAIDSSETTPGTNWRHPPDQSESFEATKETITAWILYMKSYGFKWGAKTGPKNYITICPRDPKHTLSRCSNCETYGGMILNLTYSKNHADRILENGYWRNCFKHIVFFRKLYVYIK